MRCFLRGEKPNESRDLLAKASEIASKTADNKNVFFMDIGKTFQEADGTLTKEIMPRFPAPEPEGLSPLGGSHRAESGRIAGRKRRAGKAPKGFEALFNGKDLTGWKGLTTTPKGADSPENRATMTPRRTGGFAGLKRMRRCVRTGK